MRVKKSITDKVKASLKNCRETLVWGIFELCMQIDKNGAGKIVFEHPFALPTTKVDDKRAIRFNTEHKIITSIVYGPLPLDRDKVFVLYCNDYGTASSCFLSIGELEIVYEQLKKTVS